MSELFRKLVAVTFAIAMTIGLSACGDTWEGLKSDVGDNAETVGEAVDDAADAAGDAAEDAGEAVKDATK